MSMTEMTKKEENLAAPPRRRGGLGHVQLRQARRRLLRQGLRRARPQRHRARRGAGGEEGRRREQPALSLRHRELLDGAQGPRALLRPGRRGDRRVRPARGHHHAALLALLVRELSARSDLEILQVAAFGSEKLEKSGRTDVSAQNFDPGTAQHFEAKAAPAKA